jgi:hypothetical protein
MKLLHIYHHNPHLKNKTEEEIMSTDITSLNGIGLPSKFYDRETGRKTHQFYRSEINEKFVNSVFIKFTDILENNTLIGIQKEFTFYSPFPDTVKEVDGVLIVISHHVTKIKKEYFTDIVSGNKVPNEFLIFKEKEKRRNTVYNQIVQMALISPNPLFKSLLSIVLDYAKKEIDTWKDSGDASMFHLALDNAPNTFNQKIAHIFTGTPYASIDSISKMLQLPAKDDLILDSNGVRDETTTLVDNLKFFIK